MVFAKNLGLAGGAKPLAGRVERWLGAAGAHDVQRTSAAITDTSEAGSSPYAAYALQGASIVPRCLFFVNETENRAIMRAPNTITVNPRRGSHDKRPWRDLDLAEISEQTIETAHVFDVHLGETLVPYATLEPLRAVLPLKRGEHELPTDEDGVGGIALAGLERRMRERWRTVSDLWEANKTRTNKLSVLGQLDYYGKLSSQLEWQKRRGDRPVRILQSEAGEPTAALLTEHTAMVDSTLYWITCKNLEEAYYLMAIINSNTMAEAVNMYTIPNWSGKTRHLHKHLWKLPIPEYDGSNALHADISDAGKLAAEGAARELARVRAERAESGKVFSVTVARRELRKWLRGSDEGMRVEVAVGELLGREA